MRNHSSPRWTLAFAGTSPRSPSTIGTAPLVALKLWELGAQASAHCIVWAALGLELGQDLA